jgi:hypothetical protein
MIHAIPPFTAQLRNAHATILAFCHQPLVNRTRFARRILEVWQLFSEEVEFLCAEHSHISQVNAELSSLAEEAYQVFYAITSDCDTLTREQLYVWHTIKYILDLFKRFEAYAKPFVVLTSLPVYQERAEHGQYELCNGLPTQAATNQLLSNVYVAGRSGLHELDEHKIPPSATTFDYRDVDLFHVFHRLFAIKKTTIDSSEDYGLPYLFQER